MAFQAAGKNPSPAESWFQYYLQDGGPDADRLQGEIRRRFKEFPQSNLMGGPGPDTIVGGAGFDHITGDEGDDTIYSMDGGLDQVTCGDGTDTLFGDDRDSDHEDPWSEPDCEVFGP